MQAIQLDPECVVAQTLAGHEYVANGELEQAIACYRAALGHDPRHYNAWYGLGDVEHRREKAEAAEAHFRRALAIHPHSPVLRCHLGMVLHMSGKHAAALEMLAAASKLQPSNPQARFQRANVFLALGRLEVRPPTDTAAPRWHTRGALTLPRCGVGGCRGVAVLRCGWLSRCGCVAVPPHRKPRRS